MRVPSVADASDRWPAGISGAGVTCGIKSGGGLDLGLLVAETPATWAGAFTRNAAAAPSVLRNRRLLGGRARAVVANSGNANACTGHSGAKAVEVTAASCAEVIGCRSDEVLVASTGVIGVPLDADRLVAALPTAAATLSEWVEPFATSILTTDTTAKVARASASPARVLGVAKGAAMIAPNMATMLAFVVTDAAVDYATLQTLVRRSVEESFNRISVDACESTNDSVLCLATGRAGDADPLALGGAIRSVCLDLAEQIVRDAEGGTRLVRIDVVGARDEGSAAAFGQAVAASALWRAAVHGADPNWGRVVAALGGADRSLDLGRVSITIGPELMFAAGEPVGSPDAARRAFGTEVVAVTCTVGDGPGEARVLSADLSPDYVTLNAFATT